MAGMGFTWDISHLAEEGIWQGLDLKFPRVCASHASAQALTPTNRHLSDDIIRAVAEREGVIGLVLYNSFLEPPWKQDKTIPVTLDVHLRRHALHIAGLVGWKHVGIGSIWMRALASKNLLWKSILWPTCIKLGWLYLTRYDRRYSARTG